MKKIAILGSTGSVGRQALQVTDHFKEDIKPVALAAGKNRELLLQQIKKYAPRLVSVRSEQDARWLSGQLPGNRGVEVHYGSDGLKAVATCSDADTVVTAISGAVGLEPTVCAIRAGKNIALANKETLVAAGNLVMGLAREYGIKINPVDSEHSAIWQCLNGESKDYIEKIILTASGGPFRGYQKNELKAVTPKMALNHPNWNMGPKITVDSATLMNKGLEVIEARWLFGIDYDKIKVVVHPQSIIHSMVEFKDGSVMAQMGVPDMTLPIQYALLYPGRPGGGVPKLPWPIPALSFEEPDLERFPALGLAYQAGQAGGTMPAVMNAANEVAVEAFLTHKITFDAIPEIVAAVMCEHQPENYTLLEEILYVDRWARDKARQIYSAM